MGSMNQYEMQRDFMYLFERMSEPLGYGMKGSGNNMVYFKVPNMEPAMEAAASSGMMTQVKETINVQMPKQMPMTELQEIGKLCPRNGLFGYFIPGHRTALINLRKILMEQPTATDLFNMACVCRDSQMVHPLLYVNALNSALANRKDTKKFNMPAMYEIMPELFFTDNVMKQAEKMSRMPDSCKNRIMVDKGSTGNPNDPESRLWYFREDIGVNSHHFHWHVVFPGDYEMRMEKKQDRRGELFYYMHHSMVCRYDAERLCNGLSRTKLFDFNNLVLEEGYFGKLYSTNAGRHWGTRQANTQLQNLLDVNWLGLFFTIKIEDLKRWRDRILESIDTGVVIRKVGDTDKRERLTEDTGIDILGDIIENSQDTPHAQYYGEAGFHNMGHLLIAFAHDAEGKHKENFGPMGDTSTAMRDPVFYRWHKYLDDIFDKYKQTLDPYQLKTGKWALVWDGVTVDSVAVKNSNTKFKENQLSTHWSNSDIDLARGLDFYRTEMRNGGPVLATYQHLNYDLFDYKIQVTNNTGRPVQATVRIYLAPRHDEHGTPLRLAVQRLLFFEMDKFSVDLKPGSNEIRRASKESSVTIQLDASFDILEQLNKEIERNDFRTFNDQSRCGCGWPQHLLLPKGTTGGMEFDLFVMITDYSKDTVTGQVGPTPVKPACRDALSFCGILNDKYPDARPMGYPFDRRPYNNPEMKPEMEVKNIEEYVKYIPNATSKTVKIFNLQDEVRGGRRMAAKMGMVSEMGEVMETPDCGAGSGSQPEPQPSPSSSNKSPPRGPKQQQIVIPPNRKGSGHIQEGNKNWQWGGPKNYYGNRGRREEDFEDAEEGWDYMDEDNN